MKKIFLLCAMIFEAAFVFSQDYSEKTKLSQSDGPWEFVEEKSQSLKKTRVVAYNTQTKESEILFESHGTEIWSATSLAYSEKSKTLYFFINTNPQKQNGFDVYYDFGLYAWTLESGEFISESVKRYALPPDWVMESACKSFLAVDDYQGLENYLLSFCEPGEKTFATKTETGILEGPDAIKKCLEDKSIFSAAVDLLSTHCLKKESGVLTEESAFTFNGTAGNNDDFIQNSFLKDRLYSGYLLNCETGVWLFEQVGVSYQEKNSDGSYSTKYKTGYQKPFLIEDADGNFSGLAPVSLADCKISADETDGIENIQCIEGALIFRSVEGSWWCVKKDGAYIFDSLDSAKENLSKQSKTAKGSAGAIVWVLILFSIVFVLLIALLIYVSSKKYEKLLTIKDRKKIFEIQDSERTKISREIHDTVVQSIRAIRLEAESLKVENQSESCRQKIVDGLTETIMLLRSICYNLSPVELGSSENGEENPSLVAILDTISKQFSAKTKIPCQLKLDRKFVCPSLDVEKCTHIVRIVQESFNNIEKHSYATKVSLFMRTAEDSFELYIIDDGVGCDVEKLLKSKLHFGIRNIMDRAKLMGGEIKFYGNQNEGLNIQLKIPLTKKD